MKTDLANVLLTFWWLSWSSIDGFYAVAYPCVGCIKSRRVAGARRSRARVGCTGDGQSSAACH